MSKTSKIITTSLLGLALALPMVAGAFQTGDTVHMTGSAYVKSTYVTAEGASIYRFFVIRPTVDNTRVRSAYVKACVGPSKATCAASGYKLVSVNQGQFRVRLDTDVELTSVWKKRYYTTLYGKAVSNIGY
jgi:hypothetical protein